MKDNKFRLNTTQQAEWRSVSTSSRLNGIPVKRLPDSSFVVFDECEHLPSVTVELGSGKAKEIMQARRKVLNKHASRRAYSNEQRRFIPPAKKKTHGYMYVNNKYTKNNGAR